MCRAVKQRVGSRDKSWPQHKRALEERPCIDLPVLAYENISQLCAGCEATSILSGLLLGQRGGQDGKCFRRRRGCQPHGLPPAGTEPLSAPGSRGRFVALQSGSELWKAARAGRAAGGARSGSKSPSRLLLAPHSPWFWCVGPGLPQHTEAGTVPHSLAAWHRRAPWHTSSLPTRRWLPGAVQVRGRDRAAVLPPLHPERGRC